MLTSGAAAATCRGAGEGTGASSTLRTVASGNVVGQRDTGASSREAGNGPLGSSACTDGAGWVARPESSKGVLSCCSTPFEDSGRATQTAARLRTVIYNPISLNIRFS